MERKREGALQDSEDSVPTRHTLANPVPPVAPLLVTSRLASGRRLSVDGTMQQETCGHGTCFPLRFSFCCHKGDPESWFTFKIQTGLEKNGQ